MTLIDPILIGYEQSVGAAFRTWRSARESMFLILMEELQNRGLGELVAEDASPEELSLAVIAFREAMSLAEAENRDAAARVRRLNDRVIRDLEPLLGEEHGRRVRMAYLERVTAGVIRADPLDVERVFSRLLESDRFDAENREILIGLRRSHRTTDDRHVDRLASSLEELESLVGPTEDLRAARDPETLSGRGSRNCDRPSRHARSRGPSSRGHRPGCCDWWRSSTIPG